MNRGLEVRSLLGRFGRFIELVEIKDEEKDRGINYFVVCLGAI